MSKVYAQSTDVVLSRTASLPASGSFSSGSFACGGYARLVGILVTNASAKSGSGLRVSFGMSSGSWDINNDYAPAACGASQYSLEVVGPYVKVDYITDSAASIFRTNWMLRPI
jgi:hypothetical protein